MGVSRFQRWQGWGAVFPGRLPRAVEFCAFGADELFAFRQGANLEMRGSLRMVKNS
jgi:hypothetical protein